MVNFFNTDTKRKYNPIRLPKSIRPEEFKKLISVIPKRDVTSKIMFLLAYGSGLRVSEVSHLERKHFRETTIFIENSKYDNDRIVPIPKGWKKSFINEIPFVVSVRAMQRRFIKYKILAGLQKRYSFHSLRHGFATRLIEAGVPVNQVQALLGHANLSTTNRYVKASAKDSLKSYEELF